MAVLRSSRVSFFLFAILVIALPFTVLFSQKQQTIHHYAGDGFPHVVGTQIIDGNGSPIVFRGAMMESSFAYVSQWQAGKDPTQTLTSNAFHAMSNWGMNAVRINISQWIYNTNPALYMSRLDQAVQAANQAGLYVILD